MVLATNVLRTTTVTSPEAGSTTDAALTVFRDDDVSTRTVPRWMNLLTWAIA